MPIKSWVTILMAVCFFAVSAVISFLPQFGLAYSIKLIVAIAGIFIVVHSLFDFKASVFYLLAFTPLVILAPLARIGGYVIPLRIDDFIYLALVFVWFIKILATDKNPFWGNPLNVPVAFYFSAYVAGTVFGIVQGGTTVASASLNLIRLVEFLSIFYLVYSVADPKKTKAYLMTILFATAAVILISFSQYHFGIFTKTIFDFGSGMDNILPTQFATFESSHEYTAYLIFSFFFLAAFIFNKTEWCNKKILWFFELIIFYAIANGDARSFVLFLLISFTLGLFFVFKMKKRLLLVLMLGLLFLPLIIQSPKMQKLFTIFFTGNPISNVVNDPSIQVRLTNLPFVIEKWAERPIFGNGPGFFLRVVQQNHLANRALDNSYLRALGETGIIGLSAFLFLIFLIIYKSVRAFNNNADQWQKYFIGGFILSVLCLMMIALMSDIFESFKTAMYFWILLAIIMKICKNNLSYEKH